MKVIITGGCGFIGSSFVHLLDKFGIDYLANCGGALHGHPGGSVAGAKAMRQAIDKTYADEYFTAINKWGLVE